MRLYTAAALLACMVAVCAASFNFLDDMIDDNECEDISGCDKTDCPHGLYVDAYGCFECTCKPAECEDLVCDWGTQCEVYEMTSRLDAVARCVDPDMEPRCNEPMEVGPCRASMLAWYYDTEIDQCIAFTFGGCQGNGNNFATREDCESICIEEEEEELDDEIDMCPYLLCPAKLTCDDGYKLDEEGCPTCECATSHRASHTNVQLESPCASDDLSNCGLLCEYGYKVDASGCETCVCEQPHHCEEHFCEDTTCPYGYRKDADGCDTCECLAFGECSHNALDEYCDWPVCKYGYAKDVAGCDMCQCQDNPCLNMMCEMGSVCEVFTLDNCTDCAMATRCITHGDVRAVSMEMDLLLPMPLHKPVNTDVVIENLRSKFSHLLNVASSLINHMQLMIAGDRKFHVSFLLTTSSDLHNNLVDITQTFTHAEPTPIEVQGQELIPDKQTVAMQYSSKNPLPPQQVVYESQGSNMLVYVTAGIGAFICVIIGVILGLYITRRRLTRRPRTVFTTSASIYKPTTMDCSVVIPPYLTKEQLKKSEESTLLGQKLEAV